MTAHPIRVCEDDPKWSQLYACYSHTGCPGVDFEDNCAAPWECASFGACRRLLDECAESERKAKTSLNGQSEVE